MSTASVTQTDAQAFSQLTNVPSERLTQSGQFHIISANTLPAVSMVNRIKTVVETRTRRGPVPSGDKAMYKDARDVLQALADKREVCVYNSEKCSGWTNGWYWFLDLFPFRTKYADTKTIDFIRTAVEGWTEKPREVGPKPKPEARAGLLSYIPGGEAAGKLLRLGWDWVSSSKAAASFGAFMKALPKKVVEEVVGKGIPKKLEPVISSAKKALLPYMLSQKGNEVELIKEWGALEGGKKIGVVATSRNPDFFEVSIWSERGSQDYRISVTEDGKIHRWEKRGLLRRWTDVETFDSITAFTESLGQGGVTSLSAAAEEAERNRSAAQPTIRRFDELFGVTDEPVGSFLAQIEYPQFKQNQVACWIAREGDKHVLIARQGSMEPQFMPITFSPREGRGYEILLMKEGKKIDITDCKALLGIAQKVFPEAQDLQALGPKEIRDLYAEQRETRDREVWETNAKSALGPRRPFLGGLGGTGTDYFVELGKGPFEGMPEDDMLRYLHDVAQRIGKSVSVLWKSGDQLKYARIRSEKSYTAQPVFIMINKEAKEITVGEDRHFKSAEDFLKSDFFKGGSSPKKAIEASDSLERGERASPRHYESAEAVEKPKPGVGVDVDAVLRQLQQDSVRITSSEGWRNWDSFRKTLERLPKAKNVEDFVLQSEIYELDLFDISRLAYEMFINRRNESAEENEGQMAIRKFLAGQLLQALTEAKEEGSITQNENDAILYYLLVDDEQLLRIQLETSLSRGRGNKNINSDIAQMLYGGLSKEAQSAVSSLVTC